MNLAQEDMLERGHDKERCQVAHHDADHRAFLRSIGRQSMLDYAESVEYLRGCKRLDDSHAAMKRVIVEGE